MSEPEKPEIPTRLLPSAYTPKVAFGLEENIAATLAYIFCWLTGALFLVVERKNRIVRFHAIQSIIVFLPLHVFITAVFLARNHIENVITKFALMALGGAASLFTFYYWVKLLIAAFQEDDYEIPVVGRILAAKMLTEADTQRREKKKAGRRETPGLR